MSDILLINPYYSQRVEYYSFYRPTVPFGLLYILAYLRKNGFNGSVYDFGVFEAQEAVIKDKKVRFGLSDAKIGRIIRQEKPRVVGITCMYSIYYVDVVEIAKTIKKINPQIQIVIGGNHASAYWKNMLKHSCIDIIVIGEGEETFLELVRKIFSHDSYEDTAGIAFRKENGEVQGTELRTLIEDLDQIPFPAVDAVDYRRYLGEGNPFAMHPPAAGIISSRGCPGDCVYCTVKAVWGRTWRGRSATNVVDEIDFLRRTYQIKEFAFLDDSASIDRKRWEGICDEITKRGWDIKWTTPNGIAHWTLTEGTLDKMKRAGCYRITFGIESGHPDTRRFLGKPYSLSQAKRMIQHANRIGMWTVCTNIIGFPYEDRDSVYDTITFAKKSGTDFACFYLLMPQPTSEVYQYFKKEGLLDFDAFFEDGERNVEEFGKINYVLNETGCDTVYFKKEELMRLQKQAYRSFIIYRALSYFTNPFKVARKIRTLEDARYVLRMMNKGTEVFIRTLNPLNKKSSDYLYAKTKAAIRNGKD